MASTFPACHLLKYVRERVRQREPARDGTGPLSGSSPFPFFPDMTDSDVAYVCAAIREILGTTGGGER